MVLKSSNFVSEGRPFDQRRNGLANSQSVGAGNAFAMTGHSLIKCLMTVVGELIPIPSGPELPLELDIVPSALENAERYG